MGSEAGMVLMWQGAADSHDVLGEVLDACRDAGAGPAKPWSMRLRAFQPHVFNVVTENEDKEQAAKLVRSVWVVAPCQDERAPATTARDSTLVVLQEGHETVMQGTHTIETILAALKAYRPVHSTTVTGKQMVVCGCLVRVGSVEVLVRSDWEWRGVVVEISLLGPNSKHLGGGPPGDAEAMRELAATLAGACESDTGRLVPVPVELERFGLPDSGQPWGQMHSAAALAAAVAGSRS
ncbi:unnamed protein product [Pedinophyceae sp. YPF-701]|nr:unnamed protein product [Pedinophyceae sp. YPF-701]